ncbi:hypothetical protein SeMB42_g04048 [Synchytrium endobioticum]|uniref:Uncharacterized protein n=1 Tax=Synchytrium endobioticum TaxID=286115 RepID=A0A507D248_9FUNG|nr:hypothetical protein SeMB42_g04048 [Synchytrium endobioticum]TPX51009.1 hypothetical protein SeLEV6574_g00595 [Synchytrium endobioticum]
MAAIGIPRRSRRHSRPPTSNTIDPTVEILAAVTVRELQARALGHRRSIASDSWRRDSTLVNSPFDPESVPRGGDGTGRSSKCHGRLSVVRPVGVQIAALLEKLEAESRAAERMLEP